MAPQPIVKDFLRDGFDKTSERTAAGEAAACSALPKIPKRKVKIYAALTQRRIARIEGPS
ncbi:MAG: hypothetical protein LAN18_16480 [Acidobacteriia bacterium]|nr:hypothetical protein [Terriglobia bacterium]